MNNPQFSSRSADYFRLRRSFRPVSRETFLRYLAIVVLSCAWLYVPLPAAIQGLERQSPVVGWGILMVWGLAWFFASAMVLGLMADEKPIAGRNFFANDIKTLGAFTNALIIMNEAPLVFMERKRGEILVDLVRLGPDGKQLLTEFIEINGPSFCLRDLFKLMASSLPLAPLGKEFDTLILRLLAKIEIGRLPEQLKAEICIAAQAAGYPKIAQKFGKPPQLGEERKIWLFLPNYLDGPSLI